MTGTERTADPPASSPLAEMSIGELSERTGVPASALRYYDELDLVRPLSRASGRRRYSPSAVREVGLVLLFREIGFTLAEIGRFLSDRPQGRQEMIEHKLAELTERQHRIEVARTALEHGRQCPAGEPTACPRFWSIVEGRQRGLSLEQSHTRAH